MEKDVPDVQRKLHMQNNGDKDHFTVWVFLPKIEKKNIKFTLHVVFDLAWHFSMDDWIGKYWEHEHEEELAGRLVVCE